jgi:DnaK suppressor protein
MENERLEYFRGILTAKLEGLLDGAGKTVSDMSEAEGENFPDPADRATQETDNSVLLRVKDRERKLISKVRDAMERIESGTYGICEYCGGEISEKRLEARPVTTSCIECKKEEEEEEKKKRG